MTVATEGHTCRENAADGQITLGVPLGTDAYVRKKVWELVRQHDNRLRGLALLADADGDEVIRRDANLAFQLALHGVRQSANARSAHFLRNVPRGNVGPGIEAHDNGIKATMAIMLHQMTLPSGSLCDADTSEATDSFNQVWPRMTLHTAAKGLGLRQWSDYSDAAYVGCWAQAWKETQVKLDDTIVCVLPALAEVVEEAELQRSILAAKQPNPDGSVNPLSRVIVTDMAKSLHDAWQASVVAAQTAFPHEEERVLPTCPANWLELTGGGELTRLHETPNRMQRHVSRCLNKTKAKSYERQVAAATHYGAQTQGQRFRDAGDRFCGDCYTAMPWMPRGNLDFSSYAMKKTVITRFALDVPLCLQSPHRCACGQCIILPDGHTPAEEEVAKEVQRQWLRHRYTCPSASGLRIATHDAVVREWYAMVKEAGFKELQWEPRSWDAERGSDEEQHRRPDLTAYNPMTMQRWVMDVTVAWAEVAPGTNPKLAANTRERTKRTAYKAAGKRVNKAKKQGLRDDKFVPLGYEVGGAWGTNAEYAFAEVMGVKASTSNAELTDFSIITFEKAWRERIGVALARGVASVVAQTAYLGADDEEMEGATAEDREYSPDAR